MEDTAKGIQMESVQPSEASDASKAVVENESPAKKTSMFCFKKRKKCHEKGTEKGADSESASFTLKPLNLPSSTGSGQAEGSDPLWPPGGAWVAFKRFVTLRRRSRSALKKQAQSGSRVQLEMNVEDSGVPRLSRAGSSSSIKIPCLSFSRNKKKSKAPEITEVLDCREEAHETTSLLSNQSSSKLGVLAVEGPLSAEESPCGALEERESGRGGAKTTAGAVASTREEAFVERRPDPNCYADCVAQSEIIHSENVLETEQEKQIFQLHHGSLYGNAEEAGSKRFEFHIEAGPLFPRDLPESKHGIFEAEDAENTHAGEAVLEQLVRGADAVADDGDAREANSVEVMLHRSPPAVETEASDVPVASDEEIRCTEGQPAMPGAGIVIMITEAEEDQEEEEPSQVCEAFSFPQASKQKGKKKSSKSRNSGAGGYSQAREGTVHPKAPASFCAGGQEHWTPEQYEGLLIETASSLVKAAIQSSVEQLLNEMALEHNRQNSFL
ncbi:A-kinase anchor protein 5 [Varanus komodoensis]|uniref:A-kinase anchoring protein 5 n=1 Tax=Varanus komodoensis TaxID=61221 RepID=A0A8D2IM53_VARKO|nr:A-kinase anchor protein 5 [Varanus komodoensis]